MGSMRVSTRAELEAAKNAKLAEILVVGKLADDLKKSKKIATLGVVGIAALGAAVGLAPVTGGLSGLGSVGVAAMAGVDIAVIITAAAIGIALIVAVFKDYEEVEYSSSGGLRLKRRSSK